MLTLPKTYAFLENLKLNSSQMPFWSDSFRQLYNVQGTHDKPSKGDSEAGDAAGKKGVSCKRGNNSDASKLSGKRLPEDEEADYLRVVQSWDRARTILIAKAGGKKPVQESGLSEGGVCLDEREAIIHFARCHKSLPFWSSDMISQAARDNDVSFFRRLGESLSGRKRKPQVDWDRADTTDCFLVDFWCGQLLRFDFFFSSLPPRSSLPGGVSATSFEYFIAASHLYAQRCFDSPIPPLCFLTSGGLATFCRSAFGVDSDDAIRKRCDRLGLTRVKKPWITVTVTKTEGQIFFKKEL